MRIRYVLLAALAACAGPTDPMPDPLTPSGLPLSVSQAIVGTWALQSWNANALPAKFQTYYGNDATPDSVTRVAGGSILLTDDASYQRTTDWRIEQMDGTELRTYSTVQQGSYTGSAAAGTVVLNLFGAIRMEIAVAGNVMSASYVTNGPNGPIIGGDVWRYQK